MALRWTCFVFLVLAVGSVQALPTTHFDKFFPFWDEKLQGILRNNCSAELEVYKTGDRPEGAGLSSLITPVINCVLETLPEFQKAEMAASAVVLGLVPTILQTLGSTPAETALLALRRPFLAFLLALGSPSVAIMKTSEFMMTVRDLVEHGDTRPTTISSYRWRHVTSKWRMAMSVAEYIITGAAVANVIYLAVQLGFNAIVMFAPETIFMVPLWTFICVIIHLGGVLILYLKLKIENNGPQAGPVHQMRNPEPYSNSSSGQQYHSTAVSGPPSDSIGILRRRTTVLSEEFTPAAFQEPKRLRWRQETILVNFLIWVLSIGTLINLVLGSMIFSSLLFFSVRDVLLLVARYLVSTLVCRAIVRIELSGMKECTFYEGLDENGDGHGGQAVAAGFESDMVPLKQMHQYQRQMSN
ncbi:hypothetical protein Micbo1qcDRAFT_168416 [Microdochium bolleyi]|uniref:Uncharacterized protein n=1 Tax=Microdochium bolleyi TaxID=196109 RepID=A0A136IN27_9PEZI|nr:hypothetical protein Micbo1qcDRAFT_168416 [Microdochium bolleyi]